MARTRSSSASRKRTAPAAAPGPRPRAKRRRSKQAATPEGRLEATATATRRDLSAQMPDGFEDEVDLFDLMMSDDEGDLMWDLPMSPEDLPPAAAAGSAFGCT